MSATLNWQRDGRDWPHRERSRFIEVAGQHWHVQHWPPPRADAPTWLLLHGTGAATHTWRGLAPRLAEHVGVVAPDLPGHGFSGPAPIGRAGMEGMARAVRSLLRELGVQPGVTVGHSAGAAIGVACGCATMTMPARRRRPPTRTPLVGLNAALLPLRGPAAGCFHQPPSCWP